MRIKKLLSYLNTPELKGALVTGSADDDEDTKKLLFQDLFRIQNFPTSSKNDFYLRNHFKIIEYCNLNKLSFDKNDFRRKIQAETNLKAIICIENLNPRPETLLNDINILKNTFTAADLRNNLYFYFTFSTKHVDLNEFREAFLEYDMIFEYLNIPQNKRRAFADERVWLLDKIYYNDLKNSPLIIEINANKRNKCHSITKLITKSCYFIFFLCCSCPCIGLLFRCIYNVCDNLWNRLFNLSIGSFCNMLYGNGQSRIID